MIERKIGGGKTNSNFDILKFILSIFVIMIHTGYVNELIFIRVAVPVFFIISSYFFFRKIYNSPSEQHFPIYKDYITRILKLYAFWFIIQFPILFLRLGLEHQDVYHIVRSIFLNIFIGNTFFASWYLSALVISLTIAYLLRNHKIIMLILGIAMYWLVGILKNSNSSELGSAFATLLEQYPPTMTFLAGLIFISIGAFFSKINNYPLCVSTIIFISSIALFYAVHYIYENDILNRSTTVLYAIGIFIFVKALPATSFKGGLILRHLSTINYCFHCSIVYYFQRFQPDTPNLIELIVVLIGSTIVGIIILQLVKFKHLHWLKYAY